MESTYVIMESTYVDILRCLSRPLEPEPSGQPPVLRRLSDVRAVMFDLYGTLFVSESGEVGTARQAACQKALAGAFEAMGLPGDRAGEGVRHLLDAIAAAHARRRQQGIEYPEVDIVETWGAVISALDTEGCIEQADWAHHRLKRLAVEYEGRVNPVWPMPGVTACLAGLREKGLTLGILSNAQFFTPDLFPALLDTTVEALGFDPNLQYYSYAYGLAKPDRRLYQIVAENLLRRGLAPREVLCVGNDMLNDVYPAAVRGISHGVVCRRRPQLSSPPRRSARGGRQAGSRTDSAR